MTKTPFRMTTTGRPLTFLKGGRYQSPRPITVEEAEAICRRFHQQYPQVRALLAQIQTAEAVTDPKTTAPASEPGTRPISVQDDEFVVVASDGEIVSNLDLEQLRAAHYMLGVFVDEVEAGEHDEPE